MSTYYIQRKEKGVPLETVSEITTNKRSEADAECYECNLSDPSAHHYVSMKPCREWKDESGTYRGTES